MNTLAIEERGRRHDGADARERLLVGIPVTERRAEWAGVSTAVLEGGEGPPIVFLHGPGGSGAEWLRVIPDLTTSHRVIAPDLPGQGASRMGKGPLDADRVMAWLEELIERTCPSPPVLVGQLVGGAMAARFAAEQRGRLRRLVLVVPFGLAPFEPTPAFGAALMGFLSRPTEETHDDLWRHCVFDLDAVRDQMADRWELMKAYHLDRARNPEVSAAQGILIDEFGKPAIPAAVLARITIPTTLIWGRHDSIVRLSIAEAASDQYGWPLHVIEKAGNEPALEAPDAFLRALRTAIEPPASRR